MTNQGVLCAVGLALGVADSAAASPGLRDPDVWGGLSFLVRSRGEQAT